MNYYTVKIKKDKYLKSFRVSAVGKLTIYHSKHGEAVFSTRNKDFANKVANLVDGEVEEVEP